MRRGMGRVPRMTAPPLAYPDITMTNTYANAGDEKGKKLDVPKSRVGSGERDLLIFQCTRSVRLQFPPSTPFSLTASFGCVCILSRRLCAPFRAGLP